MMRSALRTPPHARGEPMRYFDTVLRVQAAKLLPADCFATDQDVALVTVLGSCVAACLHDPVARVGGMNHFMLPDIDPGEGASARYGAHAMELLINELLKLGARRGNLEAKLFGGGNVLKSFTSNQVGTRNAQFALDYLRAEGIPVVAQDLGGIHPRKVAFFPLSGRAFVRQLPHVHDEQVVAEEQAYRQRLLTTPIMGSVELF